jgi:membrane-associated protein
MVFCAERMPEHIFEMLRSHFVQHGYWTLAGALLLENSGVPVPGETILLFASFLAFSQHALSLPWIIVVGTAAATAGDNIGYIIGHRGGRPLLDRYQHWLRIPPKHVRRGEKLFARYGSVTVFFARFVFGMRILAGPMAGVLRMPWRSFALWNFLGAASWVTVISVVGYVFGSQWGTLLQVMKKIDIAIVAAVVVLAGLIWLRYRSRRAEQDSD